MAEINTDGGKKGGGKKRSKKMSTKVDFTPMVDLGFLLITFFMLTTTLNKPKTMEINMPEKDDVVENTKIKESTALTVILTEKDKMYYFFGIGDENNPPEVKTTDFSPKGIRQILLDKNQPQLEKIKQLDARLDKNQLTEEEYKKEVLKVKSDVNALMVVIKSDEKAKYKNLIDILDEMQITNVGKYAIVDLTPEELELIKNVQI